jgi:hypothetical protein
MITFIQSKLGIPTMKEIEDAIIEVLAKESELKGFDLWINVSKHLGCKRLINIGRLYTALTTLEQKRAMVGIRLPCAYKQIKGSRYQVAYLSLTRLGQMIYAERA